VTVHSNEELLDLFLAATSLAALHRKDGGMETSRKYYERAAKDYRQEIIRRMAGPLEAAL